MRKKVILTLPSSDQVNTYISSLYVCMAIKHTIVLFVEIPRKFITAIHILAMLLWKCPLGNVQNHGIFGMD